MSILWADNFQTYGADENNLLDGIYAQIDNSTGGTVALVDDPDATAPADSMAILFSSGLGFAVSTHFRFALPTGENASIGSFVRHWQSELPVADVAGLRIFSWRDISNATLAELRVRPNGALTLDYNGSPVATSTIPVVTASAWNHIEAKITFDAAAGAFECRVNGLTVAGLTLSAQNFGSTDCAQIAVKRAATGASTTVAPNDYIKDFVVWDTNGSVNNDFLGSCQVYTLQTTGDSAANWARSTGTDGYALIDELDPNDADYIEADATPPAADVYTLENVPEDVVAVRALLPVYRARKTDGGAAKVQASLTGTASDDGADRPLTTAFTYWWDVSELSPDTGVAWTPTEVDNATLKLNRTV